MTTSHSTSRPTVGYISDIEGNYQYWREYLKTSSVLSLNSENQINLKENCHFVCGGDVCDRGDGDIRILRELLDLKSRYRERVHFVLGNRDINKLRLPFSLHESVLKEKPVIYWLDCSKQEEGKDYVLNDFADRVKWILKQTMGSPLSFECRRHELELLGQSSEDEAVAHSYLSLILPTPEGLLFQYIKQGVMAVVIEDTLYVHGGLQEEYLGFVPAQSASQRAEYEADVFNWVHKLNSFARSQVRDYEERCEEYLEGLRAGRYEVSQGWDIVGGYGHPQPGSGLVQCGMGSLPDNSTNPTVIYTSYLSNGRPAPPSTRTRSWLTRRGIRHLVVGHQPVGDSPLLLSTGEGEGGLTVCSADICYSRFVQYPVSLLTNQLLSGREETKTGEEKDSATASEAKEKAEEWNSVEQFSLSRGLSSSLPLFHSEGPRDSAWQRVNTRAPGCLAEVSLVGPAGGSTLRVVQNGSDLSLFSSERDRPLSLTVSVSGRLSLGNPYRFELGAGSLVGRFTQDGWVVKAEGVSSLRDAQKDTDLVQLGFSEGTSFRAKLLSREEVLSSMRD